MAGRTCQFLILSLLLAQMSCDVFTGPDRTISLSLSASSLALSQGDVGTVTVSVTRSHYRGIVRLAVSGLPAGSSATFDPEALSELENRSTLSISIPIDAVPASATLRVEASGDGVSTRTAEVVLTTGVKGDFALRVIPETLVVAQGGGDIASALVDPTGGFGADVAVTASGAPAGVSLSVNAPSLAIAASASAATGYTTITLQGTTPGLPPRTAQLVLSIIAPAPTTRITVPRCAVYNADWFAYKNEGFPWTSVTAAANAFTFDATTRVAIAYHLSFFATTLMTFRYSTAGELALLASRRCGIKTLTGTAMTNAYANVHAAWSAAQPAASAPDFILYDLPAGPLDFVAVQQAQPQEAPNALIVRRGSDVPEETAVPAFDFSSPEAFAPASMTLSVAGAASGESLDAWSRVWTGSGTLAVLGRQLGDATVTSFAGFAIPDGIRVASDVHEAHVVARADGGGTRETRVFFDAVGNRALTLPISLELPVCTVVASAPYARYRLRLPSQAAYGAAVSFVFVGYPADAPVPLMSVDLSATSGWFDGTPAVWDFTIPDLSQASGFVPSWMIAAGSRTTCGASAMSALPPTWVVHPSPGTVVNAASRSVNVTP